MTVPPDHVEKVYRGALVVSVFGGLGAGIWAGNVGAGMLVAAVMFALIAESEEWITVYRK